MRGRRGIASLLAIAALGLGVAAGCSDDSGGGGDLSDLKVGVLVPLTGDLAPFGGPGSKAADLAAATVNAAATESGSDLELTLVTEDTQTDPQAAQEAATKVIETDGVQAIAGPWASSETIPTAENVTVSAGIPLVSPSATDLQISSLEDDGLVFRTAPSDILQGKVMADLVREKLGPGASVVTANRNDAYGVSLMKTFTESYTALGGKVIRNVAYNPRATSLNSEAGQIVDGSPDGWVVADFPETWAKMGPALVRTGRWDPAKTFTSDGLRSNDLPTQTGVPATEGMQGSVPTSLEAPAGDAFDALWRREVGEARQTYDAQNFDAVILIALAAARAGAADPADIVRYLPEVSGPPGEKFTFQQLDQALTAVANGEDIDYEGASGPIDLDSNGDPAAANYGIWSYTGGKLVDSDQVIPLSSGE